MNVSMLTSNGDDGHSYLVVEKPITTISTSVMTKFMDYFSDIRQEVYTRINPKEIEFPVSLIVDYRSITGFLSFYVADGKKVFITTEDYYDDRYISVFFISEEKKKGMRFVFDKQHDEENYNFFFRIYNRIKDMYEDFKEKEHTNFFLSVLEK